MFRGHGSIEIGTVLHQHYYNHLCCRLSSCTILIDKLDLGSQVAKRLGNRASNQKVAGSIPSKAIYVVSFGQGTSPYLPRGNVPVLTVSRSG